MKYVYKDCFYIYVSICSIIRCVDFYGLIIFENAEQL